MNKILAYFLVQLVTKDPNKSMDIVRELLNKPNKVEKNKSMTSSTPITSNSNKSKNEELVSSLNYLKSKKIKTKQDKESIYTLEMILKNTK